MDSNLKYLLQYQLSTDSNAVLHLASCVDSLSKSSFNPSPHIPKWTTRINSLMHSKDPGARWAGCVIAHRTAKISQPIMVECAQVWVGIALPLLSVRPMQSAMCFSYKSNNLSLSLRKMRTSRHSRHASDFWCEYSVVPRTSQNFSVSSAHQTCPNLVLRLCHSFKSIHLKPWRLILL